MKGCCTAGIIMGTSLRISLVLLPAGTSIALVPKCDHLKLPEQCIIGEILKGITFAPYRAGITMSASLHFYFLSLFSFFPYIMLRSFFLTFVFYIIHNQLGISYTLALVILKSYIYIFFLHYLVIVSPISLCVS